MNNTFKFGALWDISVAPAIDKAREAAASLGDRNLIEVTGMGAYLAAEFCPPLTMNRLRLFLRKAPEGCSS